MDDFNETFGSDSELPDSDIPFEVSMRIIELADKAGGQSAVSEVMDELTTLATSLLGGGKSSDEIIEMLDAAAEGIIETVTIEARDDVDDVIGGILEEDDAVASIGDLDDLEREKYGDDQDDNGLDEL